MKRIGIALIIVQMISLIPAIAMGDNIFAYGLPNLIGRFAFGIAGVILLAVGSKKNKRG
jgi:hypothetical protein